MGKLEGVQLFHVRGQAGFYLVLILGEMYRVHKYVHFKMEVRVYV